MLQMRGAITRLQASRSILSYGGPSSDLIKQVRDQVLTGMSLSSDVSDSEIDVLEVLGEGSFGKVGVRDVCYWHYCF